MNLPDWFPARAWPIALVALGTIAVHISHTASIQRELKNNKSFAGPDDQQVRWHIQHMREDVALLCKLVMVLIGLQIWQMIR
jgi:hypothetical protein